MVPRVAPRKRHLKISFVFLGRSETPLGCTFLDEGRRSPLRRPSSVSAPSPQVQSNQRVGEIRRSAGHHPKWSSIVRNRVIDVSHSLAASRRVLRHGWPVRECRRLPAGSFGSPVRAVRDSVGWQPAPDATQLTSVQRTRSRTGHQANACTDKSTCDRRLIFPTPIWTKSFESPFR